MADIAQSFKKELTRIKQNIEMSYLHFQHNFERYNDFKRFVFQSSITNNDAIILDEVDKPQLEFNILEAYVSRLRGEFSKQEPSIMVAMADGEQQVNPDMINLLEWHLRALLSAANNDNLAFKVYTDLLAGGFSVMKVYTEYVSEMSFTQNICVDRVFDPTLCGFDPLAIQTHKGDGKYCFELYPKRKDDVEDEYGDEIANKIKYQRNVEGFSWSYQNEKEKIALIADYYEKEVKKGRIVNVVGHGAMTTKDYDEFIANWESDPHMIMQAPGIIGKPRNTEFVTIHRYQVLEDDIVDHEKTNLKYLPLIFVDGNSIDIKKDEGSAAEQVTRPYVYHAKGIQKLKNFAGQTLAGWMENMVMHKWIAAVEAVPEMYKDAYINPQKASVLLYNAFKRDDPTIPLPPPREIAVAPIPPEVTGTFDVTDKMTQVILGSYDASLGVNDNQLSGIAIQEGATQSNATAMPYVVGYLNGLNQAAKIYLDLFPKYYVTPRTIPVLLPDGNKSYVKINQDGGFKLDYQPNALQVKVEAGPSFAIEKSKALAQLEGLMKASPAFAQFMNTKGLGVLLDNLEIRGIDQLKAMLGAYLQEQQQQQAKAEQMAMQNSPAGIKAMEIQAQMQQKQMQIQADAPKIAISKQQADTNLLKTLSDIGESKDEALVQRDKAAAEEYRSSVDLAIKHADLAIKHADIKHGHAMDLLDVHHTNEREKSKIEQSKNKSTE